MSGCWPYTYDVLAQQPASLSACQAASENTDQRQSDKTTNRNSQQRQQQQHQLYNNNYYYNNTDTEIKIRREPTKVRVFPFVP